MYRHAGGRFLRTKATKSAFEVWLWDALTEKSVWVRKFAPGARRVSSEDDDEHVAVIDDDGRLTVVDRTSGSTLLQTQLGDAKLGRVRVFLDDERAFVAVDHDRPHRPNGMTLARISGVNVNGRLSAFRTADGKRLWERRLDEARIVLWPIHETPVLLAISNASAGGVSSLFQALSSGERERRVEAIHRDTGKTLAQQTASAEFSIVSDLTLRASPRSSRIELRGWQQTILFEFRPPRPPNADPSADDVGDLLGRWMKQLKEDDRKGAPNKK
jgi:hypothetical protein